MIKPSKCPKCGSEKIIEFIYGEIPMNGPITKREDVEFAGCEIPENAPKWKCGGGGVIMRGSKN